MIKIILAVILVSVKIYATQQEPDVLEFENNEWHIIIDGPTIYEKVSRLSEYRADSNRLYPTNLYRGYVAFYKVINDSIYVSKVAGYGNSIGSEINGKNGIWAEKYSGIVIAERSVGRGKDSTLLMKVKNGVIEKYHITSHLSLDDLLSKSVFDDKRLDTIIDEYRRYLYSVSNPITQDRAEYKNMKGKLVTHSNDCLLNIYLKNKGEIWEYDWERLDTSGIPLVKVKFSDKKMFIDSAFVKTRSNYLIPISLNKLFGVEITKLGYFADWYTGFIGMNYYSPNLLKQCGGYVIFEIERGQIVKTNIIDGNSVINDNSEMIKWTSSLKNRQSKRCIEHYLKN